MIVLENTDRLLPQIVNADYGSGMWGVNAGRCDECAGLHWSEEPSSDVSNASDFISERNIVLGRISIGQM